MAKISAGILSKTVGKVAGVVCSTWRGVNYIREKVTPANPNTEAQQTVRTMFSKVVAIAQQLLVAVIHTYWDVLQTGKKLTGYNRFCQANFNAMAGAFDETKIILSVGGLEALSAPTAVWDADEQSIIVAWSETCITTGQPTDEVYAYCYDESKGFMFSQDSVASREAFPILIPIGYAADIADLRVILFAYNGEICSLSQNLEVTVP